MGLVTCGSANGVGSNNSRLPDAIVDVAAKCWDLLPKVTHPSVGSKTVSARPQAKEVA